MPNPFRSHIQYLYFNTYSLFNTRLHPLSCHTFVSQVAFRLAHWGLSMLDSRQPTAVPRTIGWWYCRFNQARKTQNRAGVHYSLGVNQCDWQAHLHSCLPLYHTVWIYRLNISLCKETVNYVYYVNYFLIHWATLNSSERLFTKKIPISKLFIKTQIDLLKLCVTD